MKTKRQNDKLDIFFNIDFSINTKRDERLSKLLGTTILSPENTYCVEILEQDILDVLDVLHTNDISQIWYTQNGIVVRMERTK